MKYYKMKNIRNKEHNRFGVYLCEHNLDYWLYKDGTKWITVIDENCYNELIKVSNSMINNNNIKRNLTISRKMKNMINSLVEINIPECDIGNIIKMVKRGPDINVDDPIVSDISTSGFREIYIVKGGKKGSVMVELKITITKNNIRKTHNKVITVSNDYKLSGVIYNFIKLRCKIMDLKVPSISELSFKIAYLVANKYGYIEKDNAIPYKEINYDDLNIRYNKRIAEKYQSDSVKNNLTATGYKYIAIYKDKNSITVSLIIKHKKINKTYKLNRCDNKSYSDTINNYEMILKEYLNIRSQVEGIEMPKVIDYKTGIKFINEYMVAD